MIEPIMFFAIGFLIAGLLGLVMIPLVHNRAVRLTMRRLEAATPLSMAEIQADKDQLRAEFAMSTRRLELSVEQMKSKTTGQLSELSKKTDAINRLKTDLGEKTAAIFALEAREKALKDQLQATEAEHAARMGALRESERMLSEKETELSRISSDLGDRSATADSHRIETTTLRVQVDALKERVGTHEREAQEIGDRLNKERTAATAATSELADARGKVVKLSDRVTELEKALAVQTGETEALGRRVHELQNRMTEQGRTLGERDAEIARLNESLTATRRTESDLREELASAAGRTRSATQGLEKEKVTLEEQLAQAKAESTRLQQDIGTMKRDTEQTWAAERVENALLRERINDIAAEIARLTIAIDGADSPIEAILADDAASAPPKPVAAISAEADADSEVPTALPAPAEARGNLAERIRALQLRASRIEAPAT